MKLVSRLTGGRNINTGLLTSLSFGRLEFGGFRRDHQILALPLLSEILTNGMFWLGNAVAEEGLLDREEGKERERRGTQKIGSGPHSCPDFVHECVRRNWVQAK